MNIITFLGRNTENIINDARSVVSGIYKEEVSRVIVVTRENDNITPPQGCEVIYGSKDLYITSDDNSGELQDYLNPLLTGDGDYFVVANGGTTSQCLPVLKALVDNGINFSAWDVQAENEAYRVW